MNQSIGILVVNIQVLLFLAVLLGKRRIKALLEIGLEFSQIHFLVVIGMGFALSWALGVLFVLWGTYFLPLTRTYWTILVSLDLTGFPNLDGTLLTTITLTLLGSIILSPGMFRSPTSSIDSFNTDSFGKLEQVRQVAYRRWRDGFKKAFVLLAVSIVGYLAFYLVRQFIQWIIQK